MNNYKAGKLKSATGLFMGKNVAYDYFSPSLINHEFDIKNKKIFVYLEEANRFLGELNAYGTLVPDVNFFIQMHVVSEAVSSSKIEGTKTGIDEALLSKDEIDPEKRNDWQEVKNYIKAMNDGILNLKKLPVSTRLIKKTHKILLSGVRGEHKMPGEIRSSQNWIGGASINTAHFIPPHQAGLAELLSDWEKFWHNENLNMPVLIKTAIGHYQFETIHPFLDGNGRIGRLLISLQLIEKGFIQYPVLYISDFFERHRQSYYDALSEVRANNNLEQWILFFLEAIIETAKKSKQTFENILKLRERYEDKILRLGKKSKNGKKLLAYLFSDPIISVKDAENALSIQYKAANNLIEDFVALGILKEKTGFSRNRIFVMDEYVKLFSK